MKKIAPRVILVCVLVGAAWIFNRFDLLEKTLGWIDQFGAQGAFVFMAVYVLSCIVFVPSLIFTFSGGILFGLWGGFLLSAFGNALGSIMAFLIGRYLVKEFIEAKFAGHYEFQRLKSALESKGWKVILFARLSPVFPFSIGNYAFGTTAITIRHYFFASLVGTMPSTFVYTYLGFVTGDLAALQNDARERTSLEWGLLILGLIATVGLAWYLRRLVEKETEKY